MKDVLKLSIVLLLTSCFPEGEFGDETYSTIINKSGHNIEIQEFVNGKYKTSSFIENNLSSEFNSLSGNPGDPKGAFIRPLIDADSIQVIYFEKASIWHTKDVNSPVTKSLMLESSYEGGKVKEGLYEFTYTFTPGDFEEALEFGD